MNIQNIEQVLKSCLKTAQNNCCEVSGVVTFDEATGVLATVGTLVTKVVDAVDAVDAVKANKSQFDAILFVTGIVKPNLKNLETLNKALDNV